MASMSKNVYIYKLDGIVNKYSNKCHRTIKMKSFNVKSRTYSHFNKVNNMEDLNSKMGDHVRISKCKIIFAKGYAPNWLEEVFVIKKFKKTVLQTDVISDLNSEEIVGTFYVKELQKTIQKEFRIEKVISIGDKLYVKLKQLVLEIDIV